MGARKNHLTERPERSRGNALGVLGPTILIRAKSVFASPLPTLYLIADVDTAGDLDVDLLDIVSQFVRAGGRMVSLRPGDIDDRSLLDIGAEIAGLLFAVRGIFLVHRRVDVAIALGADGVHLPSRGMDRRELRHLLLPSAVIGRSCHGRQQVQYCARNAWDFVTLGPLFASISKPGYGPNVEVSEFSQIAAAAELPIYALGGVVPDNARSCLDAGASGVAVVGGIIGASSPFEATAQYLEALQADCGG